MRFGMRKRFQYNLINVFNPRLSTRVVAPAAQLRSNGQEAEFVEKSQVNAQGVNALKQLPSTIVQQSAQLRNTGTCSGTPYASLHCASKNA
jgi:hypothetical protein